MKSSARLFTLYACASLVAFGHKAIAAESSAFGNSVAAQRDGKIVVAGYAAVGRAAQVALVRYNADGSLDTSFNSNGNWVAVASDGNGMKIADTGVASSTKTSGAAKYQKLRIVVATALTLLFLPALYAAWFRVKKPVKA